MHTAVPGLHPLAGGLVPILLLFGCSLPQQDEPTAAGVMPASEGRPAAAVAAGPPDLDGSPGSATSEALATAAPRPATTGSSGRSFLVTRLGQEVFAPADLAIVGRVTSVARVGLGTGLVRVHVGETLVGDARPGDELAVLGFAGDFVQDSIEILFLRTFRGGPRYEVTRCIGGHDPDFLAKLAVLRRTARLLDIRASPERDSAALQLVLDSLQDDHPWTRRYGMAELGWLASTRSDLFTAVRRQMLVAIARETTDPDVRAGVESVTITLERHPLSLPAVPMQESSSP